MDAFSLRSVIAPSLAPTRATAHAPGSTRSAVERLLILNARNQGFTDAFFSTYPDALDFASHRDELPCELFTITRRAKAAGRLRRDIAVDDLLPVLLAGRGLTTAPAGVRTAAARRLAGIAIEGFRTSDTNTAPAPLARLASAVIGDRA